MEVMQETSKVKASVLPSGKLVELYIQLRDRRAKRKAAFENEDASDKTKQEKIEGLLLQRFREDGVQNVKTEFGTAYTERKISVSTADKQVFLAWVKKEDAWEFMDYKPNKTSVKTYREEHDELPPGVNWYEELVVNVRRS